MFNNRCYDNDFTNMNQNYDDKGAMMDNCCPKMDGCNCPIYECPQERCFQREINHCVEHIVPINTRIINHHVYHHVYKPMYTCCEENVCSEVNDNKCCF